MVAAAPGRRQRPLWYSGVQLGYLFRGQYVFAETWTTVHDDCGRLAILSDKLSLQVSRHLHVGRSGVLYRSPSSFSYRRRRLEDATSLSEGDKNATTQVPRREI